MLKIRLEQLVKDATGVHDIRLLRPKYEQFGDYAINLHQIRSQNQEIVTSELIKKLEMSPIIEKATEEGSFINIYISYSQLAQELEDILASDSPFTEEGKIVDSKKIHIEYGQPNTHKLPHIGHLFSYTYGESVARLLEWVGHTVYRSNYQGDVGPHVAKCLYMLQKDGVLLSDLVTIEERVSRLQQAYQDGSSLYLEDGEAKKAIDEINRKIYHHDESIQELWETTRQWSLDYYRQFEKMFGTTYDVHYYESQTADSGKKLVEDNVGTVFEKDDGAIIFRGEKFNLHTRVFITQQGTPTYEAKDIGLAQLKFADWPFEKAIITTAVEQNQYWQVVKKAIELTLPQLEGKIQHIGYGMVDLQDGKMSSRTGNIISAMGLFDSVRQRIVEKHLSNSSESENIQKKSEKLAIGAIKFAFLKSEAKKNISFNIDESISLHGNSGPYIQYTFARIQSILKKEQSSKQSSSPEESYKPDAIEVEVLRMLPRFNEAILEAAELHSPHIVATYVFSLAQKFNAFYEACPILQSDGATRTFRLALAEATSLIIQNSLFVLGIETLDEV